MIYFACPACRQSLSARDSQGGEKVFCPRCSQKLQVPAPTSPGESRNETLPGTPQPPPLPPDAGELPAAPREAFRLRHDPPRPRPRCCDECGRVLPAGVTYCDACEAEAPAPRPRHRHRNARRDLEPHRGAVILTLGLLAWLTFPFVLGPIAWYMGTVDGEKIRTGEMDPEGETLTSIGTILGMVSTLLSLVGLAVGLVMLGVCCLIGVAGSAH